MTVPSPRVALVLALTLLLATPAVGSATSAKRGLAWANGKWVPMDAFDTSNTSITSYYTWTPTPVSGAPFKFIPMLWGCDADHISEFQSALANNFSGADLTDDKVILGFNEPDIDSQSNCTPALAASVWQEYLEPLKKKGYRLGSPAVTAGQWGKAWLLEFYEECGGGCNPDFQAVHWYDMTVDNFKSVLVGYYDAFQLPMWVTEYAVQNFSDNQHGTDGNSQATQAQINSFMTTTLSWMDNQSWIERYFWFGAMYEMQGVNDYNCLFKLADNVSRTGALSALGKMYLDDPTGISYASGAASRLLLPVAAADLLPMTAAIVVALLYSSL